MKNRISRFLLIITFVFISGEMVSAEVKNTRPKINPDVLGYPTGNIEFTPEEFEAWKLGATRIEKVRMNALAMERINRVRKNKGSPELPIKRLKKRIKENLIDTQSLGAAEDFPLDETAYMMDDILSEDFPNMVDNSLLDAFPPIRLQSGGSCTAWANTYYMMTHMTALARGWDAKNGGDYYRFSPRWTYNLINYGENSGSAILSAINLMRTNGAARWSEFYNGVSPLHTAWCDDPDVWRNAINCRMDETGYIFSLDTTEGLDNLKGLLNNGYVVSYATFIYAWKFTTIPDDPSTSADDPFVGQDACYYADNVGAGAHCMSCVGYNDDIWIDVNGNGVVDSGEKGALKIANSWGTGWHDGGFAWVSYDALKGVSAVVDGPTKRIRIFSRIYWITAYPSYTPTKVAKFELKAAYRGDVYLNMLRAAVGETPPFSDPQASWRTSVFSPTLSYRNSLSFDGINHTANPSGAPPYTFVFDMTEGATGYDDHRYVLKTQDRNAYDSGAKAPVNVLSYSILDGPTGTILGVCGDVPQSTEGGYLYPWIDVVGLSDISYVKIRDAAGGGGSEAGVAELIFGETLRVWAAGYDDKNKYIADVSVDWSITGNVIGTLSNMIGNNTTLTATTVGVGQLLANYDTAIDDSTGNITVSMGEINHVKIRDAAGGGGNDVGTRSLIYGDTLPVWAAGYNTNDTYIGDVEVNWSITGNVIGTLSNTIGNNTTLTATTVGGGQLLANHDTAVDDSTGNIIVSTGGINYVKIRDAAGGAGSEVGTVELILGDTLQVWSAGYNINDIYLGEVVLDWSVTGDTIGTVSNNSGNSTTLTAITVGAGQLLANHDTAIDDSTGNIIVSMGEINYVKIRDAAGGAGSEVGTVGLILGDTLQVWSAGYNDNDDYVGDVSVNWSITGNVIGTLSNTIGNSITLTATAVGVGQLLANYDTAIDDSTGNITVTTGGIDYVKIRDAAGGAGNEVGTVELIFDDILTVWSAGYNANDVYVGDVSVNWSITGNTIGILSNVNGISASLTATAVGVGQMFADHASAADDSTGNITVTMGGINYVKIRDAAGGAGNEVGTVELIFGDTLTVWSAGYNANGVYLGETGVNWSITGNVIGTLSSTMGNNTTLSATTVGVGQLLANHTTAVDDSTGNITVTTGGINYVKIRDAAGGGGNEAGATGLIFGDILRVWAAGYNDNDDYVGDVSVSWSITGNVIGTLSSTMGNNTTLTATTVGVGQLLANHTTAVDDSTGNITVTTGGINYVKIRDAAGGGGNEVGATGLIFGDILRVWAAGYNDNDVYIGDVSVNWSITGNVIGTLSNTIGNNTTLSATTVGVGRLLANHTTAVDDSTGNITVTTGGINYVKIRDAAGGAGNEVGTVELIFGDILRVWAAGYNTNDIYLGEVVVDWSVTGDTIGTVSNNSGNSTTLTAITAGVGQLLADHSSAKDDSTGDITVSKKSEIEGRPTKPEDEGKYSLQTTVTFNWTQGTVKDSENGIVGYYLQVGTTPEGNDKFDGDVGDVLNCGIAGCINGNTYYARVRAKNGIGLYSEWSESSDGIVVDTIGPVMNIVKPAHGDTVNDVVDIIVDVSDNIKIGKIEFYINGELGAVSNDNFSWKWDSSKYEEGKYTIKVKVYDEAGNSNSDEVRVNLKGLINYPNPFRAGKEETIIGYNLSKDSTVYIGIYDFLGNLVRRWEIRGGEEGGRSGENRISWDGRNGEGKLCANGGYIVRLKSKGIAGGKCITRRIAIVK